MSNRIALVLALIGSGCVKEISSDDRLDRETKFADSLKSATATELMQLKCDDINLELAKARDDSAPEEKRMATYVELFDRVKERNTKFEESLARNPDLAYQDGSEQIIAARDGCIQSAADVRFDFEGLVREIVQLPVVDDFRDGKSIKTARLSFESLRNAIEQLELDDKDSLLAKLANAEKTVEVKEPKRPRK